MNSFGNETNFVVSFSDLFTVTNVTRGFKEELVICNLNSFSSRLNYQYFRAIMGTFVEMHLVKSEGGGPRQFFHVYEKITFLL